VGLKLSSDLPDGNALVQVATMFTDQWGVRKIRVHTQIHPCVKSISGIFKHSDLDAVCNIFCKQLVKQAPHEGLTKLRLGLIATCTDVLHAYRKNCASNPSPGQLILPESLKLLPLYCLGSLKHPAFRADRLPTDERVYQQLRLLSLSTAQCAVSVYPRLFQIHTLSGPHGMPDHQGDIVLPDLLSLTSDKVNSDGVYLVDNSESLYLWIGKLVNAHTLQELFGINQVPPPDSLPLQLTTLRTDLNGRLLNLIDALRQLRTTGERDAPVQVLTQTVEPNHIVFAHCTCRTPQQMLCSSDQWSKIDLQVRNVGVSIDRPARRRSVLCRFSLPSSFANSSKRLSDVSKYNPKASLTPRVTREPESPGPAEQATPARLCTG